MTPEEKRLKLSPAFDRKVQLHPYRGPDIPNLNRRYLLKFSTTPAPVLTIPGEVLVRLIPVLNGVGDVAEAVAALQAEYRFYYDPSVTESTATALTQAFENKITPADDTTIILQWIVGDKQAPEPWADLQTSYRKDLKKMEASPGGCSMCSKNGLISHYRYKIKQQQKTGRPNT